MKILGQVAFLLLLGGICCQNNRNAKSSGKSSRRPGNQGGDVSQPAPVDDSTPGPIGAAETGREGTSGGQTSAQQTGSQNNRPSDDMKLQFLRNTQVTCNDGTAAG